MDLRARVMIFSSNTKSFSSQHSCSQSLNTTQNRVQLQLSLTLADDLHDLLLLNGEPLAVDEVARKLLAVSQPPPGLSRQVVQALVHDDGRFCWAGDRAVSLQDWLDEDPDLADVSFVVLDLETTGARPGKDKITEIGAVRLEGLAEVRTFQSLVNPLRRIPPRIVELTGITQNMVARAPCLEDVVPPLLDFMTGAILVGHNVSFDLSFLDYELARIQGKKPGREAIDTLRLSRRLAPGLPNHRLGTVAEALGSPETPDHRALADAKATAHVFSTLVGRLQEKQVTTLHQLRTYLDPAHRRDLDKLALTKDIPQVPGNYMFLDSDREVLYVGRAERLRSRVRSYFLTGASNSRRVRRTLGSLRSIEWTECGSLLEAIVREQELIRTHRPPANVHGRRPERYQYLRAADTNAGLRLYATDRYNPRELSIGRPADAPSPLAIGPFRGRKRIKSALDLLRRCYPIRRCTEKNARQECLYGQTRSCLQPCTKDPDTVDRHDRMVQALLRWLTGGNEREGEEEGRGEDRDLPEDPIARAENLMRRLSREQRYEEAEEVRQAGVDLREIRRSYACLKEALDLNFVAFWPNAANCDPSIRMDVVWRGELMDSVTLSPATLTLEINRVFQLISPSGEDRKGDSSNDDENYDSDNLHLSAVPQEKLDEVLAVRRWFLDNSQVQTVSPQNRPEEPIHRAQNRLEHWKQDTTATAYMLMGGARRRQT